MNEDNRQTSKHWAVLRIILGNLQIVGSTLALILLVKTGINYLTLSVVIGTILLTALSRYLFRKKS